MRELLRTNDIVRLSWLQALLNDAGIGWFVLDGHTSLVEGSIGAIPRRLMVSDRDHSRACAVIAESGGVRVSDTREASGAVTEDHLLGGRVRLRQPAEGARVAIDPVFLAAAVAAEPSHQVLDIGCGTGAAMLCLAARVPQCRVVGLEKQRDLVHIAGDNVILNGMSGRLSVMTGDLLAPPPRISPGAFDHVMANPPYRPQGQGSRPATAEKATATIEGRADLGDWVRFALMMLRAKGSLHFVHRADRIDTLLAQLAGKAGEITVFPLWPGQGQPATRILVRARKQVAGPARLASGLVLHEPDGRFTEAAEAVLRGVAALSL